MPADSPSLTDAAVIVDSTVLTLVSDSAAQAMGDFQFLILGAAPSVEVGDVIVGAQQEGFLRRVTRVEQTGDMLSLETSEAALTDALERGAFSVSVPVQPGASPNQSRPDLWWGPTTAIAALKGVEVTATGISLDETVLFDDEVCPQEGACIYLNVEIDSGIVEFSHTVDVGARVVPGRIEEAHAVATGTLELDASLSATVGGVLNHSRVVRLIAFRTPFYATVGVPPLVFPVVGTIETAFVADFSVESAGSVAASSGFESTHSISVGGRYENGDWTPVFQTERSYEDRPIDWDGRVAVDARLSVRPELTVWLYGAAGGFIGLGPYLSFMGAVQQARWNARLAAGLLAELGMQLRILSFNLAEWNYEATSPELVLFEDSGTLSNTVAAIEISPAGATIFSSGQGAQTQQFAATARDEQGQIVEPVAFTWATLNPSVAVVGASSGEASAVGAGQTAICATAQAVTDCGLLTVMTAGLPLVDLWVPMTTGSQATLFSVWGTSTSDVYAVGEAGTILHYDGTDWSPMISGTTASLVSIWGSSESDVYTVGEAGTILHYDGTGWRPITSGTTAALFSVWGSSAQDVFVGGEAGTILHYNEAGWNPVASGTSASLRGVWGTSRSDVYAVGFIDGASNPDQTGGVVLHYDGEAWGATTTGALIGVWGTSASDVYAVGVPGVLHYNGANWTTVYEIDREPSRPDRELYAVWGISPSEVYAVGAVGADSTILRYDGTGWSWMTGGTVNPGFLSIWGSQSEVFAVSADGLAVQGVRNADIAAEVSIASVSPDPVAGGDALTISYTVTNTGTVNYSFGVGSEIRQGDVIVKDLGQATTATLAPYASWSATFTYDVPSGQDVGTYTARVVGWSGTPGASDRLYTADQAFEIQDRIVAAEVTIPLVSPDPVVAGTSVGVSFQIENTGNVPFNFYAGSELLLDGNTLADPPGQTRDLGTLDPGSVYPGVFTYTIPADWPDDTYTARVAVWTGPPGATGSTNLDSYDASFVVQEQLIAAAVVISSIDPNPVVAGTSVGVSFQIENTGNVPFNFYAGSELLLDGNTLADPPGQTRDLGTLDLGAVYPGVFTYTIPADWTDDTYTARVAVWTGPPGVTGSTNLENDDVAFVVEEQEIAATVVISSIDPDPVVAGNSVGVSFRIENTGNIPFNFYAGSELLLDGNTLADPPGQTRDLGTLDPGAVYPGVFTYTIPADWTDDTYTARVAVWTGPPGVTGSTNLGNDDVAFVVEEQEIAATVVISSIDPDPVVAGNSVGVSFRIENTGNIPFNFYAGSELLLDGNTLADPPGQTRDLGTLDPGAVYPGVFTYTVPADWTDDTYTARVAVWTGPPGATGSTNLGSHDASFVVVEQ